MDFSKSESETTSTVVVWRRVKRRRPRKSLTGSGRSESWRSLLQRMLLNCVARRTKRRRRLANGNSISSSHTVQSKDGRPRKERHRKTRRISKILDFVSFIVVLTSFFFHDMFSFLLLMGIFSLLSVTSFIVSSLNCHCFLFQFFPKYKIFTKHA